MILKISKKHLIRLTGEKMTLPFYLVKKLVASERCKRKLPDIELSLPLSNLDKDQVWQLYTRNNVFVGSVDGEQAEFEDEIQH